MTAQVFRAALKDLGLTQVGAAEFLRVQPTTVNRWARGKRKVPGPVAAALECLRERRVWETQAKTLRMFSTSTSSPEGASRIITESQRRRDNRPPKP